MVCATGNYARQTGRLFGLNVPSIPVEHQYIVYDESPRAQGLSQGRRPRARGAARVGPVLLPARRAHGLDLGPYEAGAPARFADGVPDWFGKSLFEGDLERLLPHVEAAQRRVPVARHLRHQGHRQRPHRLHPRRQPAHRPGLGRAQSVAQRGPQLRHHRGRRLRLAARRMDRRGRARHRHDGGRPAPLRPLHEQALRGAEERGNLSQRLRHPFSRTRSAPMRGRPRPARSTTSSSAWARCSASATAGSAPTGSRRPASSAKDKWSFRRTNYFEHVGNEARESAPSTSGVIDLTPFTKHEVTGPGAEALARRPGRQQGADQDRPHGAVPRAHPPRRHPLRIHHHQDRRASISTW